MTENVPRTGPHLEKASAYSTITREDIGVLDYHKRKTTSCTTVFSFSAGETLTIFLSVYDSPFLAAATTSTLSATPVREKEVEN